MMITDPLAPSAYRPTTGHTMSHSPFRYTASPKRLLFLYVYYLPDRRLSWLFNRVIVENEGDIRRTIGSAASCVKDGARDIIIIIIIHLI